MKRELLQAKEEFKAKLRDIGLTMNPLELAKAVNEPFDPENPIAKVIGAIFKAATVDIGEDYEYFVADQDTKKVTSVVNGSITQTAVDPLTTNDATFSVYTSEEFLVYIDKLVAGKHDMIVKKRIALTEALDRLEQYQAIQCIDAAVETARKFVPNSGKVKLDWPKLVDMLDSIFDYANLTVDINSKVTSSNIVLVTGANVTKDILKMDYDSDKNREKALKDAGVGLWIPVGKQQFKIGSSTYSVMDPDVAYLVSPSFEPERETAHFVRRKTQSLDGSGEKERISIARGPIVPEGANPKWAFTVAAMESFACVISNVKPFAKFTRG